MGFQRLKQVIWTSFILILALPSVTQAHLDTDETIEGYSVRLRARPGDVDLLLRRQFLYRDAGRFQAALLDLGRIGHLKPDHPLLPLELGLTYHKMNNHDRALEHLNHYLGQKDEEGSKQARALGFRARAQIYRLKKRYEEAVSDFRASLGSWMNQDTVFELGRLLEHRRRFPEATKLYRMSLKQLKDSAAMRISLVRSLRALERYKEAIDALNPLVKQARMPAQWLLLRAELSLAAGNAKAALRDRENAMAAINKMLKKRDTGQIRLIRARAWMAFGKYNEAKQDLLLALDRAPKLIEARRLLDSIAHKNPPGDVP